MRTSKLATEAFEIASGASKLASGASETGSVASELDPKAPELGSEASVPDLEPIKIVLIGGKIHLSFYFYKIN